MNLIPMAHRRVEEARAGWLRARAARPTRSTDRSHRTARASVVELGARAGRRRCRLAPPGSPRRFNFYKDLAGETRKFAAWVKALKPGALVAICISDTAAASTRPLGAEVYAALRALGAAADMPKIAYRAPFVFVGAKGLPPGGAVCGDGTGDQIKAILRVEARVEPRPRALPRLHALARGARRHERCTRRGATPVSLADASSSSPSPGEKTRWRPRRGRGRARAQAAQGEGSHAGGTPTRHPAARGPRPPGLNRRSGGLQSMPRADPALCDNRLNGLSRHPSRGP